MKPKNSKLPLVTAPGWRDALPRIRPVDTPFKVIGEIAKVVINVK